jgi:5-methylcytosine-specific restriction enzyme subunit McrC
LLRRGLDRTYLSFQEETTRPRGHIDFSGTAKRCLDRHHAVLCNYDELDANVLHNQILRATVHMVARRGRIEPRYQLELHKIERRMRHVDLIGSVSKDAFNHVHLHRNNTHYGFLLNVCRLAWLNRLPAENRTGQSSFDALREDDHAMEKIFETFIANFYRFETKFKVVAQKTLLWDAEGNTQDIAYLPRMKADAVIYTTTGRTIVVDAKYYQGATYVSHYDDTERIRSSHLYQITAYVRSKTLVLQGGDVVEGMLLYPQSDAPLNATFYLSGRKISVHTLNLDSHWSDIHLRLLELSGSVA